MEKYSIALAKEKDLPIINKIYETARSFMKANGNKTQWKDNYPESDLIKEDIEKEKINGVWLSLARVPGLGPGGRRFESCHPDLFS